MQEQISLIPCRLEERAALVPRAWPSPLWPQSRTQWSSTKSRSALMWILRRCQIRLMRRRI